ncbi:MAG: isochorismatase family cysteine hydrolase [Candidatus Brocadiaceae bacterium]|jgi:nicotinamidase/pyrazinamidase
MDANVAFWDVDTQHDFMDEDGKLAVPGAEQIVPNLRELTRYAVEHGIPIIASADAHEPGDPEFDQFGEHCVAGTPGQRKIEATVAPGSQVTETGILPEQLNALLTGDLPQVVIEKEDLDVFTEPVADKVLSALRPRQVYVYGVATEYCVLKTVLGLRERGYDVGVVRDAIRGIEDEAAGEALERMEAVGAGMIETAALLSPDQE